jgi:hypothetical protein
MAPIQGDSDFAKSVGLRLEQAFTRTPSAKCGSQLNSLKALVAQRIEQKTSNLLAAGSIPAEGANVMCMVPPDA